MLASHPFFCVAVGELKALRNPPRESMHVDGRIGPRKVIAGECPRCTMHQNSNTIHAAGDTNKIKRSTRRFVQGGPVGFG